MARLRARLQAHLRASPLLPAPRLLQRLAATALWGEQVLLLCKVRPPPRDQGDYSALFDAHALTARLEAAPAPGSVAMFEVAGGVSARIAGTCCASCEPLRPPGTPAAFS